MKVLSIEQMTKLKEHGVDTSKASVRVGKMEFKHGDPWYGKEEYDVFLFDNEDNDTQCFVESYRAFTLQDVVELLPCEIFTSRSNFYLNITKFDGNSYTISYEIQLQDGLIEEIILQADDILECSYQMLIWAIENGHLKTK